MKQYYIEDIKKHKKWIGNISDPIKRKIVNVLLEVNNSIFSISIPDYESGFKAVTKQNLVEFLKRNDFRCKLSYIDEELTMLVIELYNKHVTTETNKLWSFIT